MAGGCRSGVDTGDKPKHGVQRNDGAAAVAHKGQRQTDNRGDADAHTHITGDLKDQRGCGAEADHAAHIVGAFQTHINAPGDDADHHQQHKHAAHKAQLLADGGENIVGMLGEQVIVRILCPVAVKQTVTGKAAAGEGLQTHAGVEPGTDTVSVNGGIHKDQQTVSLVLTHDRPENGPDCYNATEGKDKPPQADTAGKSHADKDEHEDQRNAGVTGKQHIQAYQQTQMQDHVGHGGNGGQLTLVGCHYRCHDQNVGDLTNFRRLDINGEQGNVQPASVTGVVIRAEGDQQRKQEGIEDHQRDAVLCPEVHINGGDDGIQQHADAGSGDLNDDITQVAHVIRGTGDHDHTESGGDQT